MDKNIMLKYGKVASAFMLIMATMLKLLVLSQKIGGGKNSKWEKGTISFSDLSDADSDSAVYKVFFILLAIAAIVFVFIKANWSKIVYAVTALVNAILFILFQFTGDFADGIKIYNKLKGKSFKWHYGAGWWLILISIIAMLAVGIIDALPEITKALNNRAAPMPYGQPPMGQPMPYGQPPMGQPMQPPMGQPMPMQQPPMGQPMQQPPMQ